ncbi:hypothetical protein BaRGS_00005381, partial [Batillaria attramentaria]
MAVSVSSKLSSPKFFYGVVLTVALPCLPTLPYAGEATCFINGEVARFFALPVTEA